MNCIKCGGPLSPTNKCYACGNDDQEIKEKAYRRGIPFIIFMGLSILSGIVIIALSLLIITAADEAIGMKIIAGILIVTASFDIMLAVFILMLRKWAFKVYIFFTLINCVTSLMTLNIFSLVLRSAMPFLIYKYEYKHFK